MLRLCLSSDLTHVYAYLSMSRVCRARWQLQASCSSRRFGHWAASPGPGSPAAMDDIKDLIGDASESDPDVKGLCGDTSDSESVRTFNQKYR